MYFCISYWKRFISIAMLVEPGRVYKLIKLVLHHPCFLTHPASSKTLRFHCGCALSRTTSMMQNPFSDVCRRAGPSSSSRVVWIHFKKHLSVDLGCGENLFQKWDGWMQFQVEKQMIFWDDLWPGISSETLTYPSLLLFQHWSYKSPKRQHHKVHVLNDYVVLPSLKHS